MIYSMYFAGLETDYTTVYSNKPGLPEAIKLLGLDQREGWGGTSNLYGLSKAFATHVKESKDNSYVFMVTNAQLNDFNRFLRDYNLEKYVKFRLKKPITNPNHTSNGRNLNLVVLQNEGHSLGVTRARVRKAKKVEAQK